VIMKNKGLENIKVGTLVIAGLVFMILTLYMIGKNRSLLGKTFTITAVVHNVNGLMPGNNVRFKGIDVGTVQAIEITNDTVISVIMIIEKKMKPFIKKNAIASIGTDGVMGNKIVNINSGPGYASAVEKGDILHARQPIETDEMLRTLNTTNNNIEKITNNLYEISTKLNKSESLWTLLSDSVISHDLKLAISDLRRAGRNTAELTAAARDMVTRLEGGDGIAYKLFTDSTFTAQLASSLDKIEQASIKTTTIMNDLQNVVGELKRGEGTAGLILSDSAFRQTLYNSAINVEQGTARFNQNMEAMKSHFLFKKGYKKMEKEQQSTMKASKD
jgi:phospholipid/cholesterol/gamma-HCH transport system substrate-binding protein